LGSLPDMPFFAPLVLFLSVLSTSALTQNAEFIAPGRISSGADRTITWRPWQQNPTDARACAVPVTDDPAAGLVIVTVGLTSRIPQPAISLMWSRVDVLGLFSNNVGLGDSLEWREVKGSFGYFAPT